jgi:hypothetical protein
MAFEWRSLQGHPIIAYAHSASRSHWPIEAPRRPDRRWDGTHVCTGVCRRNLCGDERRFALLPFGLCSFCLRCGRKQAAVWRNVRHGRCCIALCCHDSLLALL